MENLIDQVELLVYKHTEMLHNNEYNTVQFWDIDHELKNLWKMTPDEFGFFEFVKLPADYAVYPSLYDDGSGCVWFTEHLPTRNVWWSWGTYTEAVDAVSKRIKDKAEEAKQLELKVEEFQKTIKKNSLDERYKDKVVVKKVKPLSPYLARLRERTEEMHADFEQWRSERNRKLANAEYVEALLNH